MLMKKSAEEHLYFRLSHVISPRLRILLWHKINVNSPLWTTLAIRFNLFKFYEWLGSSVFKDLETSRVRPFLKHAVPSAVQN